MTRPTYENGETLAHEKKVFAVLEEAWKCKLYKLPISYGVDAMAEREGKLVSWIEFKGRKHKHDEYPTLILSVLKVLSGVRLRKLTGARFMLVIDFQDGLYFVDMSSILDDKLDIRMGGRTKATRDREDIEPVVHIPIELFKPLRIP